MSTTVGQVILDARALLDNLTDDGVITADAEMLDFIALGIRYADMGQKELYKLGRIQKTIEIASYPINNELGSFGGFDNVENIGAPQYYPSESGIAAKSYHIMADRTHTIEIQELILGVWTTKHTHTGVKLDLTRYRGNIDLTTVGNNVRIKVSSSTYFIHNNRALFNVAFEDDTDVPKYDPWVEVTMPDDFKSIDMVVEEYPSGQQSSSSTYKFENPNRLYYNYYFNGVLRVIYKPVPVTITSQEQVLEIDDIVAKALSFYVASWISPYGNQFITNTLFQKYEELKIEASITEPVSEESIIDVYGGWSNA